MLHLLVIHREGEGKWIMWVFGDFSLQCGHMSVSYLSNLIILHGYHMLTVL